jgi:transposase
MARSKTGEAIGPRGRSPSGRRNLRRFIRQAEKDGDLAQWRRGRAVLGYIEGRRVIELAVEAGVTRGSVNRWLQWYEAAGVEGLRTGIAPGPAPKLTEDQQDELVAWIEAGPQAAGYSSGVWTGPMIRDFIEDHFGVKYHSHHVPRMLNQLGFSIQRPRKRLARANLEAQAIWLQTTFPAIKKKAKACRGLVMFEDEASFWLDGTLHRTWSRVGIQPRVDTFGMRKTAHIFGAISLEERPRFRYQFAPVFNGATFLDFLKHLVYRSRRKIFLIIDNGPCHNLDADGKAWLAANRHRIELFRLPPYSPEFNPIEGVWKETKKRTTHNRFFRTTEERDEALIATFAEFGAQPSLIAGQVARFL